MSTDLISKSSPDQRQEGARPESPAGEPVISDNWSEFSDSVLSTRHLTESEKESRTSTLVLTVANVCKMYVGIAFLSTSKCIS